MSLHKSEASSQDVERATGASSSDSSRVDEAHYGVKAVEATHKVFGKYSRWVLFISLGLAAYIYSLDGSTTWTYLAFATTTFGRHSFIATISVAQSIIVAVGKPVIAKIADIQSRGTAYLAVLIFYVVGYIVIASAKNVETVAGGIIIYACGYTGLQLLTQVIIADITSLKWRGLMSGLMSLPFVINAFVGSNISADIMAKSGWRWGYGMFAILIPATISPLIVTLLWAEWKARKTGLLTIDKSSIDERPFTQKGFDKVKDFCSRLDVIGLAILGTSVALILLPCTLARTTAKGGWSNPSMIAMIVVGCVLLPVYAVWDFKFAKYPVIAPRFVKNRSVVFACLIGGFDFISFYISYAYLQSFVLVVKPWSYLNATYFLQTQTVALTVFGIAAGLGMRFLHRSKPLMIFGLTIRLVGCGLMIHSRGANASDAEVVWSQLLQGIGGGFAAVTLQVTAQAAVPHADVAIVTAIVLLVTEIGGAIGYAIAGGIWTDLMPKRLALRLPFVDDATRAELFGSLVAASALPRGDPIREGVILAYDDVMKILTIVATAFAVIPLVLAIFVPNWYLGDQQNAVENRDLKGEKVQGSTS